MLRDAGSLGLAISAVAIGVRSEFPDGALGWLRIWVGWLFVGSIIATAAGSILVHLRSRRLSDLETELVQLRPRVERSESEVEQLIQDHFSIISDLLNDLANHSLGLGDTERISVYKHDGRAFVMLGRYSKNPRFDQRGRRVYPDDEGCIGVAWTSGEAIEESLPDPEAGLDRYIAESAQKWGLPDDTSRDLTMKSRSFASFALEDRRSTRIAVVVFESTQVGALDFQQLRATSLNGIEGRWLTRMIELTKPIEPSPSFAYRKGF